MSSEGCCDTEDWSSGTENSALITAMDIEFNSTPACVIYSKQTVHFSKITSNVQKKKTVRKYLQHIMLFTKDKR